MADNYALLKKLLDLDKALHVAIDELQEAIKPTPPIDPAKQRKSEAEMRVKQQQARLDEITAKKATDKFDNGTVGNALEDAKADLAAAKKNLAELG